MQRLDWHLSCAFGSLGGHLAILLHFMFLIFFLPFSLDVERYQEHKAKVLLSSTRDPLEVHADLHFAKEACLELREKCTGISTWQNAYVLARGTELMKSEESNSYAYVKSGKPEIFR